MMIKIFTVSRFKDGIFMYISAISEKIIMFLITFLLARFLNTDGFGEYSYYMALGGIIFTLFDLGGDFFQTKKISQLKDDNFIYDILFAKFLVFLVILVVGSFYIQTIQQKVGTFCLVVIVYFIDAISSVFKSLNYVLNRYYQESLILFIEKITLLLFTVVSLLLFKQVDSVFYSMIFSKLIFAIVRYINIIRNNSFSFVKINLLKSLRLIKESLIFIIHALLSTIFFQIDILMIKEMMSYTNVGIYNAAVKIVLATMIIPEILFKFFYPEISKYININISRSINSFKRFLYIQILMVIPVTMVMFFTGGWVIKLLYGSGYTESILVLRILILQILFRYCMYPFTALLSAGDKQALKTVTSAVCMLANVIINSILIPIYGVVGAAIATVITEFILLIMYMVFCRSFFIRIKN